MSFEDSHNSHFGRKHPKIIRAGLYGPRENISVREVHVFVPPLVSTSEKSTQEGEVVYGNKHGNIHFQVFWSKDGSYSLSVTRQMFFAACSAEIFPTIGLWLFVCQLFCIYLYFFFDLGNFDFLENELRRLLL
jgi:hypothetical protein